MKFTMSYIYYEDNKDNDILKDFWDQIASSPKYDYLFVLLMEQHGPLWTPFKIFKKLLRSCAYKY